METYADVPVSITEIRSDRTNNANDWTPWDALIATLREIDRGEIKCKSMVIVMVIEGDGDTCKTIARPAGTETTHHAVGILAMGIQVVAKGSCP